MPHKKAPEKIQLIDGEIANLSDAEFRTLGIRILTEMIEYGHKIKAEVKAPQSELKKNIQGTNNAGQETGTQINNKDQQEEINIQLEQNEEIRTQKIEERFRNLWDNFKHFNIKSNQKGEEEEQEIENLLEKVMKESTPIQ